MEEQTKTEEELLRLLKQYHHYRFMSKSFFGGWFAGMNLGDFMEWLQSRTK